MPLLQRPWFQLPVVPTPGFYVLINIGDSPCPFKLTSSKVTLWWCCLHVPFTFSNSCSPSAKIITVVDISVWIRTEKSLRNGLTSEP